MPHLKSTMLLLCMAGLGFAQDRGSVRGTVSDPSGASVPEAVVIARNVDTGLTQSVRTGPDGVYNIVFLPVGSYTVTTEKPGFRKAETTNVRVAVNTVAGVDVTLTVGNVDQSVEVTSAAPLLETQGSNLGRIMAAKTLQDLPLTIGGGLRSPTAFIQLTPGVLGTRERQPGCRRTVQWRELSSGRRGIPERATQRSEFQRGKRRGAGRVQGTGGGVLGRIWEDFERRGQLRY